MKVTIEETLTAANVATALTVGPFLIYSEVLEGARRPLAFLQVVRENFDLIGAVGHTIRFLKASQLSATSSTEASITGSGMGSSDKSLSMVVVTVPDVIWSATQLSDILKEDYPNVNWLRLHMKNMGLAVMENLDALVYTTMWAATGTATHSCASLTYNELVSALAAMENNDWVSDEGNPPFLIVSPDQAAVMLKDTAFVETRRYTTYELSRIVQGEMGLYAGLRVLKTSHLDGTGKTFIVFPPNSRYGPVVVLAWKRKLLVKSEYEAKYAYTYYNTSIRAKPVVVQAKGICKISDSSSP